MVSSPGADDAGLQQALERIESLRLYVEALRNETSAEFWRGMEARMRLDAELDWLRSSPARKRSWFAGAEMRHAYALCGRVVVNICETL